MNPENAHIIHAAEDADFDQIFSIREAVFERELGIPEEAQIDGFDHIAHHYIIMLDDKAVGVSRWRVTLGGNIRLERLAVLLEYRGNGFGRALMAKMLQDIPKNRSTYIECLTDQAKYFESFGFESEGDPFNFEGIPHVKMAWKK